MTTTKHVAQIERARRQLQEGKLNADQIRRFAEEVHRLNAGRSFVRVNRLALRPDEELWDFVSALHTAVQTNRVVMADGSLDIWLEGIYDNYVIVEDGNTGRYFKSAFTRAADGSFAFEPPVEVCCSWTPCAMSGEGGGEGEDDGEDEDGEDSMEMAAVGKRARHEIVELSAGKRASVFSGLV